MWFCANIKASSKQQFVLESLLLHWNNKPCSARRVISFVLPLPPIATLWTCFVFHLPIYSMNKITIYCLSACWHTMMETNCSDLHQAGWPYMITIYSFTLLLHCKVSTDVNAVINICVHCFLMIIWPLCCPASLLSVWTALRHYCWW